MDGKYEQIHCMKTRYGSPCLKFLHSRSRGRGRQITHCEASLVYTVRPFLNKHEHKHTNDILIGTDTNIRKQKGDNCEEHFP